MRKLQDRLLILTGKKELLEKEKEELLEEKETSLTDLEKDKLVMDLLETVGNVGRKQVKEKVETLVTQALQEAIYDKDLQFIVDFLTRRGQIECDLLVQHDKDIERRYVPKSDGGGTTDIITASLRFMLVTLLKQGKIIVLDEPGKWISPEYRDTFLAFVKEFSVKVGCQIIFTTQVHEYRDEECNLTRVSLENGRRSVLQKLSL